eukprot:COSAG06_NODE_2899_length_6118_cov_9.580495_2_plen_155_part_00
MERDSESPSTSAWRSTAEVTRTHLLVVSAVHVFNHSDYSMGRRRYRCGVAACYRSRLPPPPPPPPPRPSPDGLHPAWPRDLARRLQRRKLLLDAAKSLTERREFGRDFASAILRALLCSQGVGTMLRTWVWTYSLSVRAREAEAQRSRCAKVFM